MVTEQQTVDRLIELLREGETFVHVRFGDGDVMFASGVGSKITGDGEEWCPELAAQLVGAWQALARAPARVLLGDIRTYRADDGILDEWDGLLDEFQLLRGDDPYELVNMEALRVGFGCALPFYEYVRGYPGRKVFVGPPPLSDVSHMLDADYVCVPLRVAWHPEHVRAAVGAINGYTDYELALFAAGRGGKIMQARLSHLCPDLTQVDVGSGLDLLFPMGVRRGTDLGVDVDRVRDEYRRARLL